MLSMQVGEIMKNEFLFEMSDEEQAMITETLESGVEDGSGGGL